MVRALPCLASRCLAPPVPSPARQPDVRSAGALQRRANLPRRLRRPRSIAVANLVEASDVDLGDTSGVQLQLAISNASSKRLLLWLGGDYPSLAPRADGFTGGRVTVKGRTPTSAVIASVDVGIRQAEAEKEKLVRPIGRLAWGCGRLCAVAALPGWRWGQG